MWHIIIGTIILYITYRVCVSTVFPSISKRRLRKYKNDFFKKNPHIDPTKFTNIDD